MNPETFFDKFGLLADTPNGVQKLRELILQLAVQGKLVPQDSYDEPASMLLERIKAEKERLVKGKKIKRSRALPPIDVGQIPYGLPKGWEWVHLGDVGHDLEQKKPDATFTYIDVSAINKEQGIISNDVNILEPNEAPSRARKLVSKGSVIYATVRPYLLNIAIIDKQFEPEPIVSTAFAVLHPFSGILNKYLYYYLRSKPFIAYVESEMTGMAYPAINDGKLYKGLVPVPPSNEQKRIVAKVDQLMALCDELEARQQKKQEARLRLNSAALDKLLTAHEPADFAHHWQRICDNFDLLYGAPETVGELRKAILQLAVQGKLVRQDSNDEPASKVLKLISNERENAIYAKIIKKSQPLPSLIDEELPFNPPSGWVFERFGKLFRFIDYRGKTPKKVESGIRLITAKNVRMGYRQDKPVEFITEKNYHEWMTRGFPEKGDLLFTTEAPMGNVCIVDLDEKFALAQRTINLHPWGKQSSQYLMFAIMSPLIQGMISEKATGMTATGIKAAKLKLVPIPLPPLAEQRRIAAKVDQLMALCDKLEAKIEQSQTDGEKLMDAVVAELTGA